MSVFTSGRERVLWVLAGLTVIVIYASIGLARSLADELASRELLDLVASVGFLFMAVAVVTQGFRVRPGAAEVGVGIGLFGVAALFVARMGIPEERTHLFEYALVSLLVYLALLERRRNGRAVQLPEVTAIGITTVVGFIDELIQAVVPGRVFDWRDVAFNAFAAAFGVGVAWALGRIRERFASR